MNRPSAARVGQSDRCDCGEKLVWGRLEATGRMVAIEQHARPDGYLLVPPNGGLDHVRVLRGAGSGPNRYRAHSSVTCGTAARSASPR